MNKPKEQARINNWNKEKKQSCCTIAFRYVNHKSDKFHSIICKSDDKQHMVVITSKDLSADKINLKSF